MTFDEWWKLIFGDKEIPEWHHDTVVRTAYEAGARIEREACAKLLETHKDLPGAGMGYGAALIRTRKEA